MATQAPTFDRRNDVASEREKARPSISALGNSLGVFFAVTLVLCILFDLVFPAFAMNQVWGPLLPGFVWLTWTGVIIGLVESFAYGWYVAVIFVPLYTFFSTRSATARA